MSGSKRLSVWCQTERSFNILDSDMIVGDILPEKEKTEIEIGVPRERTTITQEGRFKARLEIPYTIGDANYSVLIDKEDATPESIEAAVREDALKIVESKGKKITL